METIKIWVRHEDIKRIQENQRPMKWWLEQPDEPNVSEMNISLARYSQWEKVGKKQVLLD